jgi:hypothetical protein
VAEIIEIFQRSVARAIADLWDRLMKLEPDAVLASEIQDECGIGVATEGAHFAVQMATLTGEELHWRTAQGVGMRGGFA